MKKIQLTQRPNFSERVGPRSVLRADDGIKTKFSRLVSVLTQKDLLDFKKGRGWHIKKTTELKKKMAHVAEWRFQKQNGVLPVEDHKDVIVVDEVGMARIFSTNPLRVARYMIFHFVLERNEAIFLIGNFQKARRRMYGLSDPIDPIKMIHPLKPEHSLDGRMLTCHRYRWAL